MWVVRMQVTKEQAIKLAKNYDWSKLDDIPKFLFQISQDKLCMEFRYFHKATEKALGRSVWTHEFAKPKILLEEFFKLRDKAGLRDIMVNNVEPEIRKKIIGVVVPKSHSPNTKKEKG